MSRSVTLSVGEAWHLGSGRDRIVYAGMPSEGVYSIVQIRRKFMPYAVWGYAWNLFFPKGQKSMLIDGVNITVESVSPTEVRLQV